jgi:hypothetical protein
LEIEVKQCKLQITVLVVLFFADRGTTYEFRVSAKNGVDYGERAVATIKTPEGGQHVSYTFVCYLLMKHFNELITNKFWGFVLCLPSPTGWLYNALGEECYLGNTADGQLQQVTHLPLAVEHSVNNKPEQKVDLLPLLALYPATFRMAMHCSRWFSQVSPP